MSKKKAAGKTRQHKRPNPKYLGTKTSHGETVTTGSILVRQRGTKFKAGKGVKVAKDHSLIAMVAGKVKFGQKLGRKEVSVV